MSVNARLNYVELGGGDLAATKRFYQDALGLAFTDYGPTYAAVDNEGVALGLQGDPSEAEPAPLAIFQGADGESAAASVKAAGGAITVPLFGFPGGRRFHFRDPAGNVLGVWQPA